MKRFLSLLLCFSLLSGLCILTVHAGNNPMERYEQRFKEIASSYTWGDEEDFAYTYHEICDYYSVLSDTQPEAQPDWVLVRATGPMSEAWFTYTILGDRVFLGDGALPFSHDYGVYDVRRDTFVSLESAWYSGAYPELHEKAEAARIGYPVGDADMDHDLTILDATRIQRILAELDQFGYHEDLSGWYAYGQALKCTGDYDRDCELTIVDATGIQRRLADMEEKKSSYVCTTNTELQPRFYQGAPVDCELLETRDDFFDDSFPKGNRFALINSPEELTDFLGKEIEGYDDAFFENSALYAARITITRGWIDDFRLLDMTAEGEYLYPHFTSTGKGTAAYTDRLFLYRLDKDDVKDIKALVTSAEPSVGYKKASVDMGVGNSLFRLPREEYDPKLIEQGTYDGEFRLAGTGEKNFNFAVLSSPREMYDFLGRHYDAYDDAFFADKKLIACVYRDSPGESIYTLRGIYGRYMYFNDDGVYSPESALSNIAFRVDVSGDVPEDAVWKYIFWEIPPEDAEKLGGFTVWNAAAGITDKAFFSYKDYFNPYYDMASPNRYEVKVTERKNAAAFGQNFYMPEDGSPYCTIFYSYDEYVNSPIVTVPNEKYDEAFFKKSCLIFFSKTYTSSAVINSGNFTLGSDEAFSMHVPTVYIKLTRHLDEEEKNNNTYDYNFWITVPRPTYTKIYSNIYWTEAVQ